MKKKQMFFLASIACIPLMAVSAVMAADCMMKYGAFATYQDRNPYVHSLEINASNFQNGTGTFAVEGNEFAYGGVTVEGNNVTFAQNGYFRTVNASGAVAGSDLTGAGYTNLDVALASSFNGGVTLNGQNQSLNLAAGQHSFAINDDSFDLVFNAAGFKVSAIVASYKCQSKDIVIDGVANDYIWSSKVMSQHELVRVDDSYKTEVYAVKTTLGIYVYAEQHVAVQKNAGDGWWEKDNLELRFRSGTEFKTQGLAADTQRWVCSDGRKSDGITEFATTNYVLNANTNLYDKNYELFISWAASGLSYYDKIICVFGSNYNGGNFSWSIPDAGLWSQDNRGYKTVTTSGLREFSYEPDVAYQELLAASASHSGDAWNSLVTQTHLNGNNSWAIKATVHSTRLNADSQNISENWVAEVFSPGWADGGWTFVSDWWGWGSWNKTTNESGVGIAGNCGNVNHNEMGTGDWDTSAKPSILAATLNLDVDLFIRFDANASKINVLARYSSTVSGHEGEHIYISYTSTNITYRGEMVVGIGHGDHAGATVSSIKLFEGSLM